MPPIEFNHSLEISSNEKAKSVVENLCNDEKAYLLEALQNDAKTFESAMIAYKHLLNKPEMTFADKKNMERSIQYLITNKLDTPENIKKLETINYGDNFIEIG